MVLNSLLFAVAASFIMPVLLAFAFAKGNTENIPGKKFVIVFALGSLMYALSELLLREFLLLKVIVPRFSDSLWYYYIFENGVTNSTLYFSAFSGVTIAVLQELFRFAVFFIVFKLLKDKSKSMTTASVYGFGSGWMESVSILGVMAFSYLIGNDGERGLDDIWATRALLAGIERIVYLFYHVGYSMLIVYGFKHRKKIIMFLVALVLHAGLTTIDVYLGKIGLEYTTLIFINAAMAAAVCGLAILLWKYTVKTDANIDK
ncbi:MAG: YhfC family intramembrane metalloprotease [Lachnospiraceae bacterium]|nr:YhfC family intramembrane metalloprotease [Lachnospiraceae bacterium]